MVRILAWRSMDGCACERAARSVLQVYLEGDGRAQRLDGLARLVVVALRPGRKFDAEPGKTYLITRAAGAWGRSLFGINHDISMIWQVERCGTWIALWRCAQVRRSMF